MYSQDSNIAESLFFFAKVIKPHGKNIIVGVIYRPPNQNLDSFLNEFNELTEKILRENKICYLLGDFNINLLIFNDHSQTNEFLDSLFSNLMFPMINRPTKITCLSASLIDNIFTNNFDNRVVNGLLFADISDHLPIFSIMIDDVNCLAVKVHMKRIFVFINQMFIMYKHQIHRNFFEKF